MELLIILIFIFGVIPFLVLAWGGKVLLEKFGYKGRIRTYYKGSVFLLFAFLIFFFVYEKSLRTYRSEFMLNPQIAISTVIVEQISFLDSPSDCSFQIENTKGGKKLSIDFHSINGSIFKFYSTKENETILIINREITAPPVYWIIDLIKLELKERKTEFIEETNYTLIEKATLDFLHKIVPTK